MTGAGHDGTGLSDVAGVRRRPTSMDVARVAGVSQSAVSRVFSKNTNVSATMEARVRAAAAKLGYRPNVLARSLITGRSRIIGLVVGYLDNPFYPDVLERFSEALQALGYHPLVFTTGRGAVDVERVVSELMDYQVDGIVLASVNLTGELAARCRAADLPVVLFNRRTSAGDDGRGVSTITAANVDGAGRVAEFLLDGGHRRIAHVAGWLGSSTGADRLAAFRATLEAAGQGLHALEAGDYDRAAAAAAARRLMARTDAPDAIFVGNDHMALSVMDVLRHELGADVPGDVSVVGYDDVPMAAWPSFDLTTVRQPAGRMVDAAVAEIMALIEAPAARLPVHRVLEGPLIVRGSARVPADRGRAPEDPT